MVPLYVTSSVTAEAQSGCLNSYQSWLGFGHLKSYESAFSLPHGFKGGVVSQAAVWEAQVRLSVIHVLERMFPTDGLSGRSLLVLKTGSEVAPSSEYGHWDGGGALHGGGDLTQSAGSEFWRR